MHLLASNYCSRPLGHYQDDIILRGIQSKRTHHLLPSLSAHPGVHPLAVHLLSVHMKSLLLTQNSKIKIQKGQPLFTDGGREEVEGKA